MTEPPPVTSRPSRGTTRRALAQWLVVLVAAVTAVVTWQVVTAPPGAAQGDPNEAEPRRPRPETDEGRRLFERDCAICHGPEGAGTARAPSLEEAGTASIHFMISTGRMPLSDADQPLRRKEPRYSEAEIDAIVDYAGQFTVGPAVPDVRVDEDRIARGGKLYKLHCAACHQMLGTGGVLVGSQSAPTLHYSTPTQTAEAARTGPGTMPQYSEEQISQADLSAIASYVELEIQHPEDAGGIALGHFGPWSEGMVAWLAGIGGLLAVARWIGRRT